MMGTTMNSEPGFIFIDRREGSADLLKHISNSILVELEFGDAAFDGNGPEGGVQIGVERKRIGDLINSMLSGRLSGHQIPGMIEEYYRSYLIIEGLCRENPQSGQVQVRRGIEWRDVTMGKRAIRVRDIYLYLTTLEVMTGVMVRKTTGRKGTAAQIIWLYDWWSKKWEHHKGHLAMYKAPPPAARLSPTPLSTLRKLAADLPSVGWGRSLAVEEYFKTVKAMVNSTKEQWLEIEGIGKATAKAVMEVLR